VGPGSRSSRTDDVRMLPILDPIEAPDRSRFGVLGGPVSGRLARAGPPSTVRVQVGAAAQPDPSLEVGCRLTSGGAAGAVMARARRLREFRVSSGIARRARTARDATARRDRCVHWCLRASLESLRLRVTACLSMSHLLFAVPPLRIFDQR
jgi:hypothetical protein